MKWIITCAMLCMVLTMHAQSPIAGNWNTGQQNTLIEISKSGSSYIGKILSSDNEKANLGKHLLKDISYVDGEWKGQIYVIKKERWTEATFKPRGDKLMITVGSGFMSKTVEWSKVE